MLGAFTHTRLTQASSSMVPQVLDVTLISSLCSWCSNTSQGAVHNTNMDEDPEW